MRGLIDSDIAHFELRPEFEAALDYPQHSSCPHCQRAAAAGFGTASFPSTAQPAGERPSGPSTACPQLKHETVGLFPRYGHAAAALPPGEHEKLKQLARAIADSHLPGCAPIRSVVLIGHADHDPVREQQEPGFIARISRQRALAVERALIHLIGDHAVTSQIRWIRRGVGDRSPVVPAPRTEAERARNRRVNVILNPRSARPTPPRPHAPEPRPRPLPPHLGPLPPRPQPPHLRPAPPDAQPPHVRPRPPHLQPQPPRPLPPHVEPKPPQRRPAPPHSPAAGYFPPDVIAAAVASHHRWRVPASVTLAQWALESAFGTRMPLDSNNPFGIKAAAGQPFVEASTREVKGGKDVTVVAKFRKFDSIAQAFDEHGRLLASNRPYAHAMTLVDNPDAFADALTGVYATDPRYGTVLKSIMKKYNLYQYDKV